MISPVRASAGQQAISNESHAQPVLVLECLPTVSEPKDIRGASSDKLRSRWSATTVGTTSPITLRKKIKALFSLPWGTQSKSNLISESDHKEMVGLNEHDKAERLAEDAARSRLEAGRNSSSFDGESRTPTTRYAIEAGPSSASTQYLPDPIGADLARLSQNLTQQFMHGIANISSTGNASGQLNRPHPLRSQSITSLGSSIISEVSQGQTVMSPTSSGINQIAATTSPIGSESEANDVRMSRGTWVESMGADFNQSGDSVPAMPHGLTLRADTDEELLPMIQFGNDNFDLKPLFGTPSESDSSAIVTDEGKNKLVRALSSKKSLLGKRTRSSETLRSLAVPPKKFVLPKVRDNKVDFRPILASLDENVDITKSLDTRNSEASRFSAYLMVDEDETVTDQAHGKAAQHAFMSYSLDAYGVSQLQRRGSDKLFSRKNILSKPNSATVRKNGLFYTGIVDSKEKSAAVVAFLQSLGVLDKSRSVVIETSTKQMLGLFTHVPVDLSLAAKVDVINYLRFVEGYQSIELTSEGVQSLYEHSTTAILKKTVTPASIALKSGLFLTGIVDTRARSVEIMDTLQRKGVLDKTAKKLLEVTYSSVLKSCLVDCEAMSEPTRNKIISYLGFIPKSTFFIDDASHGNHARRPTLVRR